VAVSCLSFGGIGGVRSMVFDVGNILGSRMLLLESARPYRDEKVTASLRCSCEDFRLRFQAAAVPCRLGLQNQSGVRYSVGVVG
jgi:hypothetical protein